MKQGARGDTERKIAEEKKEEEGKRMTDPDRCSKR
jgi:hypothetical protein